MLRHRSISGNHHLFIKPINNADFASPLIFAFGIPKSAKLSGPHWALTKLSEAKDALLKHSFGTMKCDFFGNVAEFGIAALAVGRDAISPNHRNDNG